MPIPAVTANASSLFNQARSGMQRGEAKLNAAAGKVAQGDLGPEPATEMIVAETMYGANAAVVRAQDEMLGTLLDVKR